MPQQTLRQDSRIHAKLADARELEVWQCPRARSCTGEISSLVPAAGQNSLFPCE